MAAAMTARRLGTHHIADTAYGVVRRFAVVGPGVDDLVQDAVDQFTADDPHRAIRLALGQVGTPTLGAPAGSVGQC